MKYTIDLEGYPEVQEEVERQVVELQKLYHGHIVDEKEAIISMLQLETVRRQSERERKERGISYEI